MVAIGILVEATTVTFNLSKIYSPPFVRHVLISYLDCRPCTQQKIKERKRQLNNIPESHNCPTEARFNVIFEL